MGAHKGSKFMHFCENEEDKNHTYVGQIGSKSYQFYRHGIPTGWQNRVRLENCLFMSAIGGNYGLLQNHEKGSKENGKFHRKRFVQRKGLSLVRFIEILSFRNIF